MAVLFSLFLCRYSAFSLKILGQISNIPGGKFIFSAFLYMVQVQQLVKTARVMFLDQNKFSAKILQLLFLAKSPAPHRNTSSPQPPPCSSSKTTKTHPNNPKSNKKKGGEERGKRMLILLICKVPCNHIATKGARTVEMRSHFKNLLCTAISSS